MSQFWKPNITKPGRTARLILGLGLLVGAGLAFFWNLWAALGGLTVAIFVLFEAARGWCLFRACGIKTRL